ncbi:hypothetical protein LAZ67_16002544 [Cordylochernes scorpioides]|uniref:Retroviral polymerase SH3-like domain-containing protein n=1 Tax=Cordylochernes scorpioides TaxID=51811 RepID=A0ABY6LEP3_9ARAC|nr:hypothetical protein LAZ67_16002544 [Cordylochernes scorpioides]
MMICKKKLQAAIDALPRTLVVKDNFLRTLGDPASRLAVLVRKTRRCVLFWSNKDGYRIWMNSNKVVTSRDVIFKETIPIFSLDIEKRNKELSSNQIDERNDTQDIEKIESNVQTSDYTI